MLTCALLQQQQGADTGPYFPLISLNSIPTSPRPPLSLLEKSQHNTQGIRLQDAPHHTKHPSHNHHLQLLRSCQERALSPLSSTLPGGTSITLAFCSQRDCQSNLLKYLPDHLRPQFKHHLLSQIFYRRYPEQTNIQKPWFPGHECGTSRRLIWKKPNQAFNKNNTTGHLRKICTSIFSFNPHNYKVHNIVSLLQRRKPRLRI